jgi:hypothetical protein
MDRGSEVTVVAYRGIRHHRRVWEDVGEGVLVCSEEDYKRALRLGEEPLTVGFPKQDVFPVNDPRAQMSPSATVRPSA